MEYKILTATYIHTLEEIVREHIDKGFEPLGGVSTSGSEIYSLPVFIKAAVKK